jgi:hypothetical protein
MRANLDDQPVHMRPFPCHPWLLRQMPDVTAGLSIAADLFAESVRGQATGN